MKVCYLTWGETPRFSGVFKSQVLSQFASTQKVMPDSKFFFLSGLPVIHSGIIREKVKYFDELGKIRKFLNSNNIEFEIIPIFCPQTFVNSSKLTFDYMHLGSQKLLAKRLQAITPDIVHCRSYHATWTALQIKEKYHLNYKVIFDARGYWPMEVAYKKSWEDYDDNYIFLKSIEDFNLKNADVTVAVSKNMEQHYNSKNAKKTTCIYLSADVAKLANSERSKNTDDDILIFCYVGALEDKTWHQPSSLYELYGNIRKINKRTKLIIATQSNHNKIREVFKDIPQNEVEITKFTNTQELRTILNKSDFGILSYYKASTATELEQAKAVLSIKFVEYLSGGVPVIVNSQCKEVADLVEHYAIGIAYDPNNIDLSLQSLSSLKNNLDKASLKNLVKELFSYESNAIRYRDLYSDVLEY